MIDTQGPQKEYIGEKSTPIFYIMYLRYVKTNDDKPENRLIPPMGSLHFVEKSLMNTENSKVLENITRLRSSFVPHFYDLWIYSIVKSKIKPELRYVA